MHPILNAHALTALLLVVLPAVADAQPLQFTHVTSTFNPMGGAMPFNADGPALEGTTVAFGGRIPITLSNGVFVLPLGGTATQVAGPGPLPGGEGSFSTFGGTPSLNNGRVAFQASTSLGSGIFSNVDGTLRTVVGPGFTDLPGGYRTNRWGQYPSLNDGVVAFSANPASLFSSGIYSWTTDQGLSRVGDESTPDPGSPGSTIGQYGYHPATDNHRVAFLGYGERSAVYVSDPDGGNMQVVARQGDPAPGGAGSYRTMSQPFVTMDEGTIMFNANTTIGDGLFASTDGLLRLIADQRTTVPGSTRKFSFFGDFAVDGSSIAFVGTDTAGKRGLYADFGFGLRRIIEIGDSLEGATVEEFWFNREGMDGNRLAFQTRLTGRGVGIYIVTAVPAPGAAALLGLATMTGLRRRR
ncbi:MAG: hypothetical protein IT436_13615 [Phycisphaerales bacterium]|nr:hypothetical protein [Phycisphaerales bacterium]